MCLSVNNGEFCIDSGHLNILQIGSLVGFSNFGGFKKIVTHECLMKVSLGLHNVTTSTHPVCKMAVEKVELFLK